jgi:hypothetical protein
MVTKIYLIYFVAVPAAAIVCHQLELITQEVNLLGKYFTIWLMGAIVLCGRAIFTTDGFAE